MKEYFIKGNERITQVQLLEKQDNFDFLETLVIFGLKKTF